ncbi:DUF4369 domain-containing protein [Lutibacter sp.]|uniref:DUF4369 domain-containing protein n=1 Tax=Lutibacter sp. TaxID=1925666 RepID=UPI00273653CF|nr:DUF4369 domain-containing protein [Lutibacter sp.]MDP3312104.1 DUF4369 domain-containing protein [Lutibacter sp.]
MKQLIIVLLAAAFFIGCESKGTLKEAKTSFQKEFELKGKIDQTSSTYVYLNQLVENGFYAVDSTKIINNTFIFIGSILYPERYALTFNNSSEFSLLVLENTNFSISLISENIPEPIIENSSLNNTLQQYRNAAKEIFKKIDYLYPHFQKARLENNDQRLKEIGLEIKNIEKEFETFTYKFIIENNNSFVSAMILRDQLKVSQVDTFKIKELYKLLSSEVKESPDSQFIAITLKLN